MIQWILTDSQMFSNLEIDENILYFLEDTRDIYKGNECYTKNIFFVNDLPKFAIKDKLYINKTTLETKIWNGVEWKTIIPKVDSALQDGVTADGLVTGNSIKTYVTKKLEEFSKTLDTSKKQDLTTDDIVLSKDIKLNKNIGSMKAGQTILKGTKLTDILIMQLIDREAPVYVMPKLYIRPGDKIVEVGTIISPLITAEYEKNDAGEMRNYKLEKTEKGITKLLKTSTSIVDYQESPYMVSDGENCKYTVTLEYSDGPVKQDNIGEQVSDNKIKAGTLTASCSVTGQRYMFYGSKTSKEHILTDTIDSDYIRSFKYTIQDPKDNDRFEIQIQKGDKQIIFAYPAYLKDIESVFSKKLNLDVTTAFEKHIMKVYGANKFEPIDYKVYMFTGDIAFINNDTYVVII